MKIRHLVIFNHQPKQLSVEEWAILRNNDHEVSYYVPKTRVEWEKKVKSQAKNKVVESISNYCKKHHLNSIFSVGCGIAVVEYQLKELKDFQVTVTDITDSIERIRAFNYFDQAFSLDVLNDPLPNTLDWDKTLFLLPRIDTEFEDPALRQIFAVLKKQGVKHILFIPAGYLTLKTALVELRTRLVSFFTKRKPTFCGYQRSLSHMKRLMGTHYVVTVIRLNGWPNCWLHAK